MFLTLEHLYKNPEEEGLFMQVDLERVFHSVEHNFLFKVIKNLVLENTSQGSSEQPLMAALAMQMLLDT